MSKIILAVAMLFLFMNLYYFFYAKNLFLGSIAMILTVALNFLYATMSNVNEIKEDENRE